MTCAMGRAGGAECKSAGQETTVDFLQPRTGLLEKNNCSPVTNARLPEDTTTPWIITGGASSPPPLPGLLITRLPTASCWYLRPCSAAKALSQSSTLGPNHGRGFCESAHAQCRRAAAPQHCYNMAPALGQVGGHSLLLMLGGPRNLCERPKVAPQGCRLQALQSWHGHCSSGSGL
jgi:hypothetical protein